MKKVRFETPTKVGMDTTKNYNECHSPRPFVKRQFINFNCDVNKEVPLVFTNDPVQRFDNSDSSPYPVANKTVVNAFSKFNERKAPSSELDLSMLDCAVLKCTPSVTKFNPVPQFDECKRTQTSTGAQIQTPGVLTSIENKLQLQPPNILKRDNEFFLRRENIGKLSIDPLHEQFNNLILNKENNRGIKMNEATRQGAPNILPEQDLYESPKRDTNDDCRCHHCTKIIEYTGCNVTRNVQQPAHFQRSNCNSHHCMPQTHICDCNMNIVKRLCHCTTHQSPMKAQDAVDKKTWAIEKYEKTQKGESLEVEKQSNIFKEKREPTVADLFKIIKLQNEQLQLLQEKVDKFISSHNHNVQEKQKPIQNYVTEQMAVQTMNSEQHKISIGVMTSFEMVRTSTSTVINKEIVKQSEAQIQCNRSQINIKEVVSKKATNLNFLDGIPPVSKNVETDEMTEFHQPNLNNCHGDQITNLMEDKTLNELSLYNVQVDNATTPLMSPEQSLYLDIRDYSGSESGSDDQSNVGWTYYNKVMTHVNGMLQDSDMPSSASALYRQTKQRCVQMQVDKSSASAKRVTFGDDPLVFKPQHIVTPTDTSLKMNQLAAKYLKNVTPSHTPSPRAIGEMSFATKNYMERHQLLQGQQFRQHTSPQQDIPKFLDITALKQQPKFI